MADHCEMCAETYDSKFLKHMTQNYKWTYTVFYILYFLIPILKWFLKLLTNKNLKCVKCICINLTLLWKSISKIHYNQLPSEVTSKEVFSEETKIEILGLSSKCYMWWKPKNAHCPEHTICNVKDGGDTFQQDNYTKHTVRATTKWYRMDHSKPRPKSNWEIVARLENWSSLIVSIQSD